MQTNLFNKYLLIFQLFCCITATFVGLNLGAYTDLTYSEDTLYKNTFIESIDVGNCSIPEATTLITENYLTPLLENELKVYFNDKTFTIPLKDLYESCNLEQVVTDSIGHVNQLSFAEKLQYILGNPYPGFNIEINFNSTRIDSFIQQIINTLAVTYQDAHMTISHVTPEDNTPTINITPHVQGISIGADKLKEQIKLLLYKGEDFSLDLAPLIVSKSPAITTDVLESIDTVISTSITNFDAKSDSGTNIKLSAQALNGTILMPNEAFSYNTIIGETTYEKGYVEAPIIVNGKSSIGLGGGICQVSSTLYNAILQTGLNSTVRRPHSKPVAYLPLGLDATVSWESIDYQFKNTLDHPLYIQSFTEGNDLIINIFSNHKVSEIDYQLKSEVVQELNVPTQYVPASNLSTSTQQLIQAGSKGYKVKVTREAYKDGDLISSELISLDTYNPLPAIYEVGSF